MAEHAVATDLDAQTRHIAKVNIGRGFGDVPVYDSRRMLEVLDERDALRAKITAATAELRNASTSHQLATRVLAILEGS